MSNHDVNAVAEMVLLDAKKDGRSMRRINSYNSTIASNEYRIALRTNSVDYHFMVQHSNGSWSHKPSICKSRLANGNNPDTISWDSPQIDGNKYYKGEIVEIGVNVNYYDSDTVYFAVTK